MIRRDRKPSQSRLPVLFILCLPFLLLFIFYYFIASKYLPTQRTTILFLTDPVEVASYEPTQQQWTRVQFPASTHVSGIQGLGEYAVDSLWNIASTEGSPSAVVLGSLTDELGVPIEYYVGTNGKTWLKEKPDTEVTQQYLSITGIFTYLFHNLDTNLSLPVYIALTRSLRSTEKHLIHTEYLEKGSGLVEKKLPDNSLILQFDRDQFDSMTDDIFEDREIREERMRVAVYNTTGRPFLGTRVARILDRVGINIIQVGNEDAAIEACEITGVRQKLQSKTAKTIEQLFTCIPKEIKEEGRADLTVRIGNIYERRFLPKE